MDIDQNVDLGIKNIDNGVSYSNLNRSDGHKYFEDIDLDSITIIIDNTTIIVRVLLNWQSLEYYQLD